MPRYLVYWSDVMAKDAKAVEAAVTELHQHGPVRPADANLHVVTTDVSAAEVEFAVGRHAPNGTNLFVLKVDQAFSSGDAKFCLALNYLNRKK